LTIPVLSFAFFWWFNQRIIKKKREEGEEKGGKKKKKKGKERGESEGRATPSHKHSKKKWERLLGFRCILN
jgi:hypothetical protein